MKCRIYRVAPEGGRRYVKTVDGMEEAEKACMAVRDFPKDTLFEAWDDATDRPVASIGKTKGNRIRRYGDFVKSPGYRKRRE